MAHINIKFENKNNQTAYSSNTLRRIQVTDIGTDPDIVMIKVFVSVEKRGLSHLWLFKSAKEQKMAQKRVLNHYQRTTTNSIQIVFVCRQDT